MSPIRLAKKLEFPTSIERKTLMRKRRKLLKKSFPSNKIERRLIQIEHDICASHLSEKVHDENMAIAKIKNDPNYFFRFAKKTGICSIEIGSLMNLVTESLTDDKHLPKKTQMFNKLKHKKEKWMTDELLKLVKLYRDWKSTSDEAEYERKRILFRTFDNIVERRKQEIKNNYYFDTFRHRNMI